MAVESHQTVTIREVNKSLLAILSTFFGIGIAIATWYFSANNNRLDKFANVQNEMNLKIEKFSITTELTDLKVTKLENRADAFMTKMSAFDKELSESKMILSNHDQLLKKHENQIKELEKR